MTKVLTWEQRHAAETPAEAMVALADVARAKRDVILNGKLDSLELRGEVREYASRYGIPVDEEALTAAALLDYFGFDIEAAMRKADEEDDYDEYDRLSDMKYDVSGGWLASLWCGEIAADFFY